MIAGKNIISLLSATLLTVSAAVCLSQDADEQESVEAPPEWTLRLSIPNTALLSQTIGQSEGIVKARQDPLWSSAEQFMSSARALVCQYLTSDGPASLDKLWPKRWDLYVFALPEDTDEVEEPVVVVIGDMAGNGTALHELWEDRVLPRLKTVAPKVVVTSSSLEEGLLYTLETRGKPTLGMVFSGESLILGLPDNVAAIADVPAKQRTLLPEAQLWKDVTSNALPNAIAQVAMDGAAAMQRVLSAFPEGSQERRQAQFFGLEAVTSVMCSTAPESGRFQERYVATLAPDRIMGLQRILLGRKPIVSKSRLFVPGDVAFYLAFSVTNGLDMWTAVRDELVPLHGDEVRAKSEKAIAHISSQLGLDFEQDVLTQIGPEVFVAVDIPPNADWSSKGKKRFRMREAPILVGFQIQDRTVAQDLLKTILTSPLAVGAGVTDQVERYEDVEIHFVDFPKAKRGGQLAYALIADFAVFARDGDTLRDAIDALVDRESIAATELYAADGKSAPAPLLLDLYANLLPIAKDVVTARLPDEKPVLAPLVPALTAVLEHTGPSRFSLRATDTELQIDGHAPLPLLTGGTTAAGLDQLVKPPAARKAKLARQRMRQLSRSLRRYHRVNKTPPEALEALTPRFAKKRPTDPFTDGADFGYGVSHSGKNWVLTSVGPDGVADIPVDEFVQQEWEAIRRADTPEAKAEAERLVYRFKAESSQAEKGWGDEGDIVETGKW
ncbi:MAG: DUF3352 domain-containing protein [Lentisphaerae bacterium]|jgi:hypothetical protein|nr:DUF3352 domain-containing protein [Lentisphaerota bacterium]MBT4820001.1 DUF3352 domain-containing protein [Lentisphaerota bacterium]MBT5612291.1 DUF3352 domain-containing protein [Lentisphaerota bacterium]MBT7060731.1 DUF3352 domain-containing protein [Lentisphaerota bacterium]MBT7845270.1 DUF3352 domain-containing protein [Lentisphaerota bacterium]